MAMKQKPMLPTLKEKKRYVSYKIHSLRPVKKAGFELVKTLNGVLGVFDAACAGLMSIVYDEVKQTGVLKTSNSSLNKTRMALLMVNSLHGQKVMIQPLITSGVVKKAKEAM